MGLDELSDTIFGGWSGIVRVLIVGVASYAALVAIVRISGKRTLAKMNAFDLVVTVALGSTLASIVTSDSIALAEGVLTLGLLVALQFVVTWSSVRARWVKRLVTGEPRLLAYRGEVRTEALRRARVTRDEVFAAVRARGVARMRDVQAVVLETDGSFSVLAAEGREPMDTLEYVRGAGAGG